MNKKIKTALIVIVVGILLYLGFVFSLSYLINNGYTNAESASVDIEPLVVDIPASNFEIYEYLYKNPNDTKEVYKTYSYMNGTGRETKGWFPENNGGLDFVVAGIGKRRTFMNSIEQRSDTLGIDPDLVTACVLGEQIRIANKGARGKLKDIVVHGTPTLFRSYDVSLGIGGIKFTTAQKIRDDAKEHLGEYYETDGRKIANDIITDERLTKDDGFNAKYATYLVYNILTRWRHAGYDISDNPGVVCTLYNMGNPKDKVPHENPQIGGSIIRIGDRDYVYGGLSMGVYRYLKIFNN